MNKLALLRAVWDDIGGLFTDPAQKFQSMLRAAALIMLGAYLYNELNANHTCRTLLAGIADSRRVLDLNSEAAESRQKEVMDSLELIVEAIPLPHQEGEVNN